VEQSPLWEADSHSACQEIPLLLWNPKVHFRVQKNQPSFSILSQMNPVRIFSPYFPKIHSNIIFPLTPRSSEWFLPFRFSDQNIVWISRLPHSCYMPRPRYRPSFDRPNDIRWSVQVMKILIMQSSTTSRQFSLKGKGNVIPVLF